MLAQDPTRTGIYRGFPESISGLEWSRLTLRSWVLNSTEGVVIEVEGEAHAIDAFARTIPLQAPPIARVDHVAMTVLPPIGYVAFAVQESQDLERGPSLPLRGLAASTSPAMPPAIRPWPNFGLASIGRRSPSR